MRTHTFINVWLYNFLKLSVTVHIINMDPQNEPLFSMFYMLDHL